MNKKDSIIKGAIVLSVVFSLLVMSLIIYFFYSFHFSLSVCGEKGIEYPAASFDHSSIEISAHSIETGELCHQLIALESEDPERTTCIAEYIDDAHKIGFVVLERWNVCREPGSFKPKKNKFYGVVTEDALYTFLDITYYSNTPEEDSDFMGLSKEEYESLLAYIDTLDDSPALDVYAGHYSYYWTKANDLTCYDVELTDNIKEKCLLSAVEDLYPDFSAYQQYMSSLLAQYDTCNAFEDAVLGREHGGYGNYYASHDIGAACAMVSAEERAHVFYCMTEYFGNDEEGFYQRYECIERSGYELNVDYCESLSEDSVEFGRISRTTKQYCYEGLAWQTLDEGYCYKAGSEVNSEYVIERCLEEVEELKTGFTPFIQE